MVGEIVLQHQKVDCRSFEISNRDGIVLHIVLFREVIGLDQIFQLEVVGGFSVRVFCEIDSQLNTSASRGFFGRNCGEAFE